MSQLLCCCHEANAALRGRGRKKKKKSNLCHWTISENIFASCVVNSFLGLYLANNEERCFALRGEANVHSTNTSFFFFFFWAQMRVNKILSLWNDVQRNYFKACGCILCTRNLWRNCARQIKVLERVKKICRWRKRCQCVQKIYQWWKKHSER